MNNLLKMTIIYCDHCGSPQTTFKNLKKEVKDGVLTVDYDIECLNCHKVGHITETWKLES